MHDSNNSSIGTTLRQAREAKGFDCSAAAAGTRIKVQVIEAMERDDYSKIPAAAYAKGFIKLYAEFLELDPEPLVKRFSESYAPRLYSDQLSQIQDKDFESGGRERVWLERIRHWWLVLWQAVSRAVPRISLRLPAIVVTLGVLILAFGLVRACRGLAGRRSRAAEQPRRLELIELPPDPYIGGENWTRDP